MDKHRIHLILEYDGTAYSGWQRQANAPTVQEEVEKAVFSLTGEQVCVHGASRTDAGVHALGQSAHFDTVSRIPGEKFAWALNTRLPDDIRVRLSENVPDSFHARFSGKGKQYRYLMQDSPHEGALNRLYVAHSLYKLDDAAMAREAKALLGTHDFAAFAASGSVVRDTVRRITRADVTRSGSLITLFVEGNGFLYNMVRIIAGTLMLVGAGKLPGGTIARSLTTLDRLDLGVTAPAKGLTLMEVYYDELPDRNECNEDTHKG